ncbi:hypothetical protein [Streptomyces mirabilis]|uniref:hypothetical protein n=1 Tax=Streptomyces mirabilis TaxID=68239 RepID=UPI00352D1437
MRGAHALGLAAALARPGQPVLVVGADALSTVYQHTDSGLADMIYKLLFGDGGAATVVSVEPLKEPGLYIEDTWTYLHRDKSGDTTHYYKLRADRTGYHFDSTPAVIDACSQVAPASPGSTKRAGHPSTPSFTPAARRSSTCSSKPTCTRRRQCGTPAPSWSRTETTGGPTVLRVLARVHDAPPPTGSRGILFGVGPRFCASASRIRWAPLHRALSGLAGRAKRASPQGSRR